jgi:hypothetical protein
MEMAIAPQHYMGPKTIQKERSPGPVVKLNVMMMPIKEQNAVMKQKVKQQVLLHFSRHRLYRLSVAH